MVQVYAHKSNLRYIDLSMVPINTDALRIIPEERARSIKMAVFDMVDRHLHVAIISPLPVLIQEELRRLREKKYTMDIYMVSNRSLNKAWSRYGDISYAIKTERGVIDISSDDIGDIFKEIKNLEKVRNIIQEAVHSKKAYRISKVIELILYSAHSLKASDVHIEPSENNARVRFRLDGILVKVINFDVETYNRILSRIKLTAGLKINLKNNAQDGRFTIKMLEKNLEIRTSTLPGAYGESIVMRILDPLSIATPLEELGMTPYFLEILLKSIKKPTGMIVNTGPTGSGKSTTLFALLRKKVSPNIKIITIEDPIEYNIKGITQTQVNKKKGYTFLNGLKSSLRQDPDVLMVGEIRDLETAKVAVNASLTGHLLLTTLHTNSAAGAFPRLLDLGIDPKILATSIEIIIAQRLVRKLCVHCKKIIDFNNSKNIHKQKKIKEIFASIEDKEKYLEKNKKYIIYKAVGCKECNETGFRGRMAVIEGILMDKKLEKILKERPTEREIVANTRHQGILTLKQDGILKVIQGKTSFDELSRIIDV